MNPRLAAQAVCEECASLAAKEEISMARKVGQIIARGDRRWLIRVYLGRDHETNKRKYHNRTIHGPMLEAQAYLTRKLREPDLDLDFEGASRAADQPCGDRGGLERTLGNQWYIAMHIKDVTP